MKPYFLVVYNTIRFGMKRLLHGTTFITGAVQMLGWNTRLSIAKSSQVQLGDHLVSDGRLVIIAREKAHLVIGARTYFNEGVMISCLESVSIGNACRFGPNVKIFDNNHKFSSKEGVSSEHITAPISIGNHCWIGANVTILKGTQIGDNCVIGAGCVVKGIIPPGSLVTQSRKLEIHPIQDED